jgi:hypothetical protein
MVAQDQERNVGVAVDGLDRRKRFEGHGRPVTRRTQGKVRVLCKI